MTDGGRDSDELPGDQPPGERRDESAPAAGDFTAEQPPADPIPADELPPGCAWGALVAVAGVVNFLAFPIIRGTVDDGGWPLVAMLAGFLCAQFGIAALYLVWGLEPFHVRLLKHWGATLGLFGCWAFGFALALADQVPHGEVPKAMGMVLCVLPLISLAAQLPLWPLRIYAGWRIERPGGDAAQRSAGPLSIRDMILGTVVVAVTLAALRLVPGMAELGRPSEVWIMWVIWTLSIAGASIVTLVPATLICFRFQDGAVVVGTLIGVAVLAWVVTLAILGALGSGGFMPAEIPAVIALIYGSFTATLALPLFIVRSQGHRLTFSGERK